MNNLNFSIRKSLNCSFFCLKNRIKYKISRKKIYNLVKIDKIA